MYLISLSMITYTVAKLHRRGSTSSCLRLNLHSGLEFHRQKFGFHGDALDVTLDQIFRIECRVCGNSVCPVVEILCTALPEAGVQPPARVSPGKRYPSRRRGSLPGAERTGAEGRGEILHVDLPDRE